MSIYELEKLATPGRIEFNGYGGVSIGDNTTFGCVSFFDTEEQADATAKMFAHCRNNFMRALEELGKAVSNLEAVAPDCAAIRSCVSLHRQVIAELEEVQT